MVIWDTSIINTSLEWYENTNVRTHKDA